MKAVYLFCAVLVLALSSSTPAHADISTSATPTTDTGYGESPATDTPVGTGVQGIHSGRYRRCTGSVGSTRRPQAPRLLVLLQDNALLPARPHHWLRFRCHHRRSGRRAFQPHQVHCQASAHQRGDNRLPAGRCGKYRSRIRHLFRTRRSNDRLPAFRITGKYCGRLPNGRGQGCRTIARHPCPLIPRRVTPEVSGQARHLLT